MDLDYGGSHDFEQSIFNLVQSIKQSIDAYSQSVALKLHTKIVHVASHADMHCLNEIQKSKFASEMKHETKNSIALRKIIRVSQ